MTGKITELEAMGIMKRAGEKRIQAFDKAYETLCEEHQCEKVGIAFILDGRIGINIQTRVRPPTEKKDDEL